MSRLHFEVRVGDERLGQRGNRLLPDHDEEGWRNASRPARAEVVAIGDSQTWGSEVSRAEAWPRIAEELSGLRVYSMALGGYGPWEYAQLVPDALRLEPERVLVALYFGNDLADAWNDVYVRGRAPELASDDPALRAEMERAAVRAPLHAAWTRTRAARRSPLRPLADALLAGLDEHTASFRLVRGAIRAVQGPPPRIESSDRSDFERYRRRARAAEPGLLEAFEDGVRSTVFVPRARLAVVDGADPRIADAVRIFAALLERMQQACADRAELAVVLVPTKELVYAERVARRAAPVHDDYHRLVRAESELRERIFRVLETAGVARIDTLPFLRASLEAGRAPYLMDWNGHPNAEGNRAIARAVIASGLLPERAERR